MLKNKIVLVVSTNELRNLQEAVISCIYFGATWSYSDVSLRFLEQGLKYRSYRIFLNQYMLMGDTPRFCNTMRTIKAYKDCIAAGRYAMTESQL